MKASIILTVVTVLAAKVSAKCWAEDLGWPCCSPGNTDVYYVDNDGEWGVEDGDWCGMATEDDTSNNNDPWSFDMSNTGGNTGVNTGGFDMGGFGGQGGFDMGAFSGFGGQGGQGGFDMGAFGGQGGQGGFGGFDMGGFGGQGGQGGFGGFDMGGFGGQGGQSFGGFDMGGFGGGNTGGFTQNDFLGNNDPNAGLGGNSSYETVAAQGSDVNCSGKTLKSNTTLNINGRKVIVKFPSGFSGDKPAPLLINYHPIMGSASQWEGGSQTAKAALSDGAVVAFMDGAQGPMGQAWNVGPCCTDADDVQFTRDFIKQITAQACVDPKRIYAAGFSMGGGMSNYAGCFLSDVIAAAAPSAFDLAQEIVSAGKCKPSRPFPILNFRGTQDNVVMYNGGLSQVVAGKPITFLGAKGNFAEWAKMNGCTGTPKSNTPGNGCEMYENCEGGAKVGLCTINGGGHSEGDGRMGWNFLKQFSL